MHVNKAWCCLYDRFQCLLADSVINVNFLAVFTSLFIIDMTFSSSMLGTPASNTWKDLWPLLWATDMRVQT